MKKILVILLVLLTIGSFAFAETKVSFGIWARSTVYLYNQAGNQEWGPDYYVSGPYMEAGLNIENGPLSFHWYQKIDTLDGLFNASTMYNAYGSVVCIPDLLTLDMGMFKNDIYRHAGPINDADLGTRFAYNGIALTAAPKDMGLSASIFWDVVDGDAFADNMALIGAGASYTLPDMVKITVGTNGMTTTRNFFGYVDLLMVKDLTAFVGVVYDNNINLGLNIIYAMDALKFNVEGEFYGTATPTYWVLVRPSYTIGDYTVAVDVQYNEDASNDLTIYPWIQINPLAVKAGFKFNMDLEASTSTWSIPLQITWSL